MNQSTQKICTKCKKPKDINKDFYKQSGRIDGRNSMCKSCKDEKQYSYREEKKSGIIKAF